MYCGVIERSVRRNLDYSTIPEVSLLNVLICDGDKQISRKALVFTLGSYCQKKYFE